MCVGPWIDMIGHILLNLLPIHIQMDIVSLLFVHLIPTENPYRNHGVSIFPKRDSSHRNSSKEIVVKKTKYTNPVLE